MYKLAVDIGLILLRLIPGGSLVAAILPSLGNIVSGLGTAFAAVAKIAAAFIEGVLEILHSPKALMVVAAAFVYGTVFHNDKHADELAKARAERCACAQKTTTKPTSTSPPLDLDIRRWLGF
jgi:hypothetical protein